MFCLTREVRFAVNQRPDDQLLHGPSNSHGGYPSLTGAGQYFAFHVSLAGPLQPDSSYLLNIKEIDATVRQRAVPKVEQRLQAGAFGDGRGLMREVFEMLRHAWPAHLTKLRLALTPSLSITVDDKEFPMVRLSQKFEFSASHRLHNPNLSPAENARLFGKCNNPHGHGHNYEIEVTLVESEASALPLIALERLVGSLVIDRLDHRNLNVEVPEFRDQNPTVENIARVIYRQLAPHLREAGSKLACVTVWETPKTSCMYSEAD